MADEDRGDAAEEGRLVRPALLARDSLFKRLGRDALHCLLPFLDLRSLGALDSAMTNRAEREEPWLPAVAQMDNKVLCKLLAKELWFSDNPVKVVQWLSCLKWMTSKDIALPTKLMFPRKLKDTDYHLACLYSSSKARKILKIEIKDCDGVTAAGLKALERCSGLKSFSLWGVNSPDIVKELAQTQWQCFKTLECIDLRACCVDPDCMSAISSQCAGLKELTISFFGRIASPTAAVDETMKRLSTMSGLEVLHVIGARSLSSSHIKSFTNLRSLDFDSSFHTDALLEGLASIKTIQQVKLSVCRGLTAAGFEHIKGGLSQLLELDMHECQNITDDNLASLSGMTKLRCLRLREHALTDQGLAHLKGLTSLQELSIGSKNVTDAGLAHLSRMPLLKLSLCEVQITDAGLDRLHCFSELKELDLWRLNLITEEGVERVLAACKKIEEVILSRCAMISNEFKKSLMDRGF